jgi:DNA-binding MarR family transcriptional regulator
MILFNIGESELTVGELTQRGYYQGSNVSYNVKKLVENGYLIQERSLHDRRSFHVRASEKGVAIFRQLHQLYDQHVAKLEGNGFAPATLDETARTLRKLEQFWAAVQQLAGRLAA